MPQETLSLMTLASIIWLLIINGNVIHGGTMHFYYWWNFRRRYKRYRASRSPQMLPTSVSTALDFALKQQSHRRYKIL